MSAWAKPKSSARSWRCVVEVIAVLDATKWGRIGLASFAAPEVITCVITDVQAPADLVEQMRALGIKVTLV